MQVDVFIDIKLFLFQYFVVWKIGFNTKCKNLCLNSDTGC